MLLHGPHCKKDEATDPTHFMSLRAPPGLPKSKWQNLVPLWSAIASKIIVKTPSLPRNTPFQADGQFLHCQCIQSMQPADSPCEPYRLVFNKKSVDYGMLEPVIKGLESNWSNRKNSAKLFFSFKAKIHWCWTSFSCVNSFFIVDALKIALRPNWWHIVRRYL